jgi:hypothetical protein
MYVTKLLVVALGMAAVVTQAVRGYALRTPGWVLFASVMPLSLVAGPILAFLPSDA